jgi:hypothetical protein
MTPQIEWFDRLMNVAEKFGIPVAMLVVVAFFLWKAAVFWAPILRGWGDKWSDETTKSQETMRSVANTSIELQRSNSMTLQAMALTLDAVHDTVNKIDPEACPLAGERTEQIRNIQSQIRLQRKQSEHRAAAMQGPSSPDTPGDNAQPTT